jgi:hypothetical protein
MAILLATAACDLVGSDVAAEGAYVLDTVNSLPVPATVLTVEEADGSRWSFRVLAGGLELEAGRYLLWIDSEAYQDGELAQSGRDIWSGSYTTRRSQVTFVADGTGATGTGRAEGRELRLTIGTVELGDLTLAFRRAP